MAMEWVRGEAVGRGSFGSVNLAKPRKQGTRFPQLMAVKSCGSSRSASLMNEKSVLEQLSDCPQIIRCFGGDSSFESGEKLFNLLLEYASGGSLAERVKNSGDRRLPESEVQRYTRSVLRGLCYIHKNGFVHCDVKLQNILLCSGNQNDVAKIADFGLAKRAGERVGFEMRGTPLYMAPETVSAGEIEPPADVWGLGCLVAEMVTGAPAWRCSPDDDVCKLMMRIGVGDQIPDIPGNMSAEGKDFLEKCFVRDPAMRWTAEMLSNHPFVVDQDHDDDDHTVPLDDKCEPSTSGSPTGPFDFPGWESPCSITTSLPSREYSWETDAWSSSSESNLASASSRAERLRQLATEGRPDWSVSEGWVAVR
ncbi:mitogen-activated protein kinase kinase kinase 20-like [Rhododendron vialii]|uniref:mitogen-activated protein kinase kinase kinase 20-like n=1 Tax=Rhododendron vialii TaxID=182163 RepID=UPI00265E8568|nr:mitogen-activated protein kinase kinase kinase 20-like [Rhododendron vialii]